MHNKINAQRFKWIRLQCEFYQRTILTCFESFLRSTLGACVSNSYCEGLKEVVSCDSCSCGSNKDCASNWFKNADVYC